MEKDDAQNSDAQNTIFYASADTSEEIDTIIRNYETEHIVRFSCSSRLKGFNAEYEPWKTEKVASSRLKWYSEVIPPIGVPYVNVSHKTYACQYGKRRHASKAKHVRSVSSKIGCPCKVRVAEILRLISPKPIGVSSYQKRLMAVAYRNNIEKYQNGLPHSLAWKREFHVSISPLSSHNHVTGEGAAEHQRIDPLLIERIRQLATSGILEYDVIRDHLIHYVEEEMFKGKEPPLKTNRRFYPPSKAIRNHIEKVKIINKSKTMDSSSQYRCEDEMAASSITDVSSMYYNGEEVEVSQYEYDQQKTYDQTDQYFAKNSKKKSMSAFSSPSNQGSRVPGYTRTLNTRQRSLNPKEKPLGLVKKLQKIINTIENQNDLKKLTTSLVNVIMLAKPMVPEDKMGVLYEEEKRVLMHPRRIRFYKKKPLTEQKQRHPDLNPSATKLPDKKVWRAEEKKKDTEAKAERAKVLADRNAKFEKLLDEAIAKRKAQTAATVKVLTQSEVSKNDGAPPQKVIILQQIPGMVLNAQGSASAGGVGSPVVKHVTLVPVNKTPVGTKSLSPATSTKPVVIAGRHKTVQNYRSILVKTNTKPSNSVVTVAPLPSGGVRFVTPTTATVASAGSSKTSVSTSSTVLTLTSTAVSAASTTDKLSTSRAYIPTTITAHQTKPNTADVPNL